MNLFRRKAATAKTYRVRAVTSRVIADRAGVRQRVFNYYRRRAYECVMAHATELMYAGESVKRHEVFHYDMARERGRVGEDDVAAYSAIMRDMRLGHEKIIRANLRYIAAALSPAMNRSELAKHVALARAQ